MFLHPNFAPGGAHRVLRRWVAVAGLVLALPSAVLAADPRASKYYEDALARYEKRDIAGAVVQLKNALQIDNSMLPVHVLLGKALLANGEVNAAEVAFSEALRLGVSRAEVVVPLAEAVIAQGKQREILEQPRFAVDGLPAATRALLLLQRSAAAADLGDSEASLRAVEQARAIGSSTPEVWLAEVPLRLRNRQFAEANAAVERALALAPDLADAWMHKGSIAHLQGDAEGALAAYARALKSAPGHVATLSARAGLYIDLGRNFDAKTDVESLLRGRPKDLRGLYLKALLAERAGDLAASRGALRELTEAVDVVPIAYIRFRPQVLILAGLAHWGLDERAKAKPYLEAAQRAQGAGSVAKLLAQINLSENNLERAVDVLESYLKTEPRDAQALAMLASAFMAQGRNVRATNLMEQALREQDRPALRTTLGISLAGTGRTDSAIAELEAAYRRDPKQTTAATALAALYLQGRMTGKAVAVAADLVKAAPQNAGYQNLLGMALSQQGKRDEARRAFERAAELDAKLESPKLGLARLDAAEGKFDAATARTAGLLQADPKNVDALFANGLIAQRRGRADESLAWFQKAADHAGSKDLRPLFALVELHLTAGRAAQALEAAQNLSARGGNTLPVMLALSRAQIVNRDLAGAKASLSTAARLAGFEAPALAEIALLQMRAGDLADAAHSVDKALSSQPDQMALQALATDIALQRGDLAAAERQARQIVEKFPKRAAGHVLLGNVAMARGQPAAAVEAFRRAQGVEPGTATTMQLLGALSARGSTAELLTVAEGWLAAHPRDRVVLRALADTQARSGKLAAARASYDRLLQLSPGDGGALNNLAQVLIQLKDPGALKVAERAQAAQPDDPNVIGTLGWAALKAGQTDRALQLLRDARLRNPSNPETRFYLASALAQVGRKAEARDELQAALGGGRDFASAQAAGELLKTLK